MNSLKESLKKYYYFFQGHINYWLYYKTGILSLLLPEYVREQIQYRFIGLAHNCREYNECLVSDCGCDITKVIMSDKVCKSKSCRFVKFKDKREWIKFKTFNKAWNQRIKKRIEGGKELLST